MRPGDRLPTESDSNRHRVPTSRSDDVGHGQVLRAWANDHSLQVIDPGVLFAAADALSATPRALTDAALNDFPAPLPHAPLTRLQAPSETVVLDSSLRTS